MNILLIGANGQLGLELLNSFRLTHHNCQTLTRKNLDLCHTTDIYAHLSSFQDIDLIINCAAFTNVELAEIEKNQAFLINEQATLKIALFCKHNNVPLIHFSTDYVFDGLHHNPYFETDTPHPINVYGASKLGGEQAIIKTLESHIILRVSWVFGIHGKNFVKSILNILHKKKQIGIVSDQYGTPTAASDIARVIKLITNQIEYFKPFPWGIYHYTSKGPTSRYQFAYDFLNQAKQLYPNYQLGDIYQINSDDFPVTAVRPKHAILCCDKICDILRIKQKQWHDFIPSIIKSVCTET